MSLREIQQQLKAPKNQNNDYGGFKYRSCEDILEAVKPLLGEMQLTLSDEIVEVGGRVYVKATATIGSDLPVSGLAPVTVTAFAREAETKKGMDDSQITGTASSYARKYALNGLFLIDDTKDADTDAHKKQVDNTPDPYEEAVKKHQKTIISVQNNLAEGNMSAAAEAWFELAKDEQKSIWRAYTKGGCFTTNEQRIIKSKEFRESHFGPEAESDNG